MHPGEDAASDSLPPFSLESLAFNGNEDKLSPDDLAWVDSCIVKDPVLLEENWEALKKALLEVIDTGVGGLGPSATGDYDSPSDINMLPSSEEAEIADLEEHGNHAVVSMHDGVVEEVNEIPLQKEIGNAAAVPAVKDIPLKNEIGLLLQASEDNDMDLCHGDPFLHTYKELEEQKSEVVSSEPELDSTTDKTGSTKDIFRVWDLDIPSEEADLVKQLRKAFEETSFHFVPSNIDDSEEQKKGLEEEESISDLIAGLGDLALNDNVDGV